jgi:hypothetical protein
VVQFIGNTMSFACESAQLYVRVGAPCARMIDCGMYRTSDCVSRGALTFVQSPNPRVMVPVVPKMINLLGKCFRLREIKASIRLPGSGVGIMIVISLQLSYLGMADSQHLIVDRDTATRTCPRGTSRVVCGNSVSF